jgi:hypothetical protein
MISKEERQAAEQALIVEINKAKQILKQNGWWKN